MARRGVRADTVGYVYMLHFNRSIGNAENKHGQARHYIGWTEDPPKRIDQHTNGTKPVRGSGTTARIVAYVQREGIGFEVAWTMRGTINDERRLKRQRMGGRLCPLCGGRLPKPAQGLSQVGDDGAMTITDEQIRRTLGEIDAWAEDQDNDEKE